MALADFLGGANKEIDKSRDRKTEAVKAQLEREKFALDIEKTRQAKADTIRTSVNNRIDDALNIVKELDFDRNSTEAQKILATVKKTIEPIILDGNSRITGLGGSTISFADVSKRIDIAAASRPTAAEKGAASKAEDAAAGKTPEAKIAAAEEAGVNLTANRIAEAFGFSSPTEPAATEFFRALDELDTAAASGQMDTPRAKRLEQFVQSKFQERDFFFRFNPESGEFEMGQGTPAGGRGGTPGGLGAGLSTKDQLVQQKEVDRLTDTIAVIDAVMTALGEDPTAFGIVGSTRGGFQTLFGVAADAIEFLPSGGTFNDLLAEITQSVTEVLGRERSEQALGGLFDPQISQNEQIENFLSIQLASLRINLGESSIRAIKAAFAQAKDDVKLTGATSSADVEARLNGIRGEFARALASRSRRLGGGGRRSQKVLRFDSQGKQLQ